MADDYAELYTVRAKVKGKLEETMKKESFSPRVIRPWCATVAYRLIPLMQNAFEATFQWCVCMYFCPFLNSVHYNAVLVNYFRVCVTLLQATSSCKIWEDVSLPFQVFSVRTAPRFSVYLLGLVRLYQGFPTLRIQMRLYAFRNSSQVWWYQDFIYNCFSSGFPLILRNNYICTKI
jgi:hypothetical protein